MSERDVLDIQSLVMKEWHGGGRKDFKGVRGRVCADLGVVEGEFIAGLTALTHGRIAERRAKKRLEQENAAKRKNAQLEKAREALKSRLQPASVENLPMTNAESIEEIRVICKRNERLLNQLAVKLGF